MTGTVEEAPRRRLHWGWYVVGIFCGLQFMSMLDRYALSLLIQPVKADLAISDTQIGMLMGPAFAMVYAGAAFPIAWAIDRLNRKWIVICGVSIWSMATCASAFAPDFSTLFILRMGVGVGEAVLNPAAVSLIGDLFTRDRRPAPAAAFNIAAVLGGAGSFVFVAMMLDLAHLLPLPSFLASLSPWRITLLLAGLPGFAIVLLMALTMREPQRPKVGVHKPEGSSPNVDSAFQSRKREIFFYSTFLPGVNAATTLLFICAIWMPNHLIRKFGEEPQTVGYYYGVFALIGGVFGNLMLPILAQRFAVRGHRENLIKVAIASVPVGVVAFLVACNAPNFLIAVSAVAVFQVIGCGIGGLPTIVVSTLGGARARARLLAAHLLLQATISTSLGPYLIGYLSDGIMAGSLGGAMTLMALIVGPISFALFWLSYRPYREAVTQH